MPLSPAARRAAALRAALRHPDAVGVRALNAWAGAPPAAPARPAADPARAARWAAARAAEPSQAALAAATDAAEAARGGPRPRPRWATDRRFVFAGGVVVEVPWEAPPGWRP